MRKLYFDDYDDEITDDDIIHDMDPESHNIDLDNPDDLEYEKDIDDLPSLVHPKTLLAALRDELKLKEYERGSLTFIKDGVDYEGVPMLEINPNKFVFKIEPSGKMQSIVLSDIQVLA